MFRHNLPLALFTVWPQTFMCHCGHMEMEQTLNKSQHKKLTLEKKILRYRNVTLWSQVRRSTKELHFQGRSSILLFFFGGGGGDTDNDCLLAFCRHSYGYLMWVKDFNFDIKYLPQTVYWYIYNCLSALHRHSQLSRHWGHGVFVLKSAVFMFIKIQCSGRLTVTLTLGSAFKIGLLALISRSSIVCRTVYSPVAWMGQPVLVQTGN